MSSCDSKFIVLSKELYVCGLRDTSCQDLYLNGLEEFVAERGILYYHSVDLPLRLKVFTGSCRSEIYSSCVSGGGSPAGSTSQHPFKKGGTDPS